MGALVFDRAAADQSGVVPAAGLVGERQVAVMSAFVGSAFTTTQYGNVNSLALTAGDWLIVSEFVTKTGGTMTDVIVASSLFTGNTTTDHTAGDNQVDLTALGLESYSLHWRVASSAAFTVFAKAALTFTVAANVIAAKISAYRWR